MRVFIGTLECGEGEFKECVEKINAQKGLEIDHFIVSGKPENEAHSALYSKWNSVKSTYDFFVKVDADTILRDDDIISSIITYMKSDENITSVQAPIFDYYSDGMINGLNCYSKKVVFNESASRLYCDRVDSGHIVQIKGERVPKEFVPAAYHCTKSTNIQAFHFGFHRQIKGQDELLNRVNAAWSKSRDTIRGYVLLGARFAKHNLGINYSYCDRDFVNLFNQACREYKKILG